MIGIVNYGMGNLGSVQKAFAHIGVDAVITSDQATLRQADKLVLPGVGHFRSGMEKLRETGLLDVLNEEVLQKKKPILGICLGMQLFTSFSEEGDVEGLNWIPARTSHFGDLERQGRKLPVPHMGWNTLDINHNSPLFEGIEADATFYFVHSYAVSCEKENNILASTTYGHHFHSAIYNQGNIMGTQFHPEKSHGSGLKLIRNFVNNF